MKKNRIWWKRVRAGLIVLLLAGTMMNCAGQHVRAEEMVRKGTLSIAQDASWTDRKNGIAEVTVTVSGLKSLEEGITQSLPELQTETVRSFGRKITLSMYLSEYFILDNPPEKLPEGCLTEEVPIWNQEGRGTMISRVVCPLPAKGDGVNEWQITIPVTLRQEYRFLPDAAVYPVSQDMPLKKNRGEEKEICAFGTFLQEEAENGTKIIAYTSSAILSTEAAQADFVLSMQAQKETLKAGERVYCSVFLNNTGETPLTDIRLKAKFLQGNLEAADISNIYSDRVKSEDVNSAGSDIAGEWEPDPKLEIQNEEAVLTRLSKGETKELVFSAKLSEEQSGVLIPCVYAAALYPGMRGSGAGENIIREASLSLGVQALKASYTVQKTADREEAGPGDTVTYQISIHNTGERTLHSVISTERFLHSNIRAQFQEKEGIELNGTKTQARIPQIAPGDCVNLKAYVTLPDGIVDEKLINQVIVVTDETGEDEAVRSQAQIKVRKNAADAPETERNAKRQDTAGRSAPKTGDRSYREFFEMLILMSILASAAAAGRLLVNKKPKRKD